MTKLSVKASLHTLDLYKLPALHAAEAFCSYVNAGLTLYVNCDKAIDVTQGDLSNIVYEDRGHDPEHPHFCGVITTNHETIAIDDVISTCFVTLDPWTKKDLLVSCFKYKNKDYLVCDETGQFINQFRVCGDSAYLLIKDIANFKKSPSFTPKSTHKGTVNSEAGLTKALALLIHDMASKESGIKYQSGKKINASAVKNHILELATKYEIDDSNIRSLHNKITPMLKEYELLDFKKNSTTKK
jgi:hypothetical protein